MCAGVLRWGNLQHNAAKPLRADLQAWAAFLVSGVCNDFLFVLVVLAVVAALVILKMKQPTADDELGFARKDVLFTPAERSFLGVLEQALDSRYRVFGKVRLGDIVKPAKGLSNSKRTTAQNKVNQKHVDFVICAASDLAVVGVVELDDKSHERDDRAGRDQFVDRALADAKIPVIHFSAKKGYALPEVRAKLAECLAIGTAPSSPPVILVAPVSEKPATILKKVSEPVTEKPGDGSSDAGKADTGGGCACLSEMCIGHGQTAGGEGTPCGEVLLGLLGVSQVSAGCGGRGDVCDLNRTAHKHIHVTCAIIEREVSFLPLSGAQP